MLQKRPTYVVIETYTCHKEAHECTISLLACSTRVVLDPYTRMYPQRLKEIYICCKRDLYMLQKRPIQTAHESALMRVKTDLRMLQKRPIYLAYESLIGGESAAAIDREGLR